MRTPIGRRALAVVLGGVLLGAAGGLGDLGAQTRPTDVEVPTPFPGDRPMWDHLTSAPGSYPLGPDLEALILPHHFSDQQEINALWRSAAAVRRPSLVVLLSPDHFLAGPTPVTLAQGVRWTTVYGPVAAADPGPWLGGPDRGAASGPFVPEHGIFTHAPFLARYFPGVPVLALLLRPGTDRGVLDALVADFDRGLPADALVAASVDFSHYNPVWVSKFHDVRTQNALETGDGPRLLGAEVDSPESLYVVNALGARRSGGGFRVLARTDLQSHFDRPIADNTSHILAVADGLAGGPPVEGLATLVVLPQAPPGTVPPGVLHAWSWSAADPDRTARLWPWLADLAGRQEEDRFLMGSDLYFLGDEGLADAGRSAPSEGTDRYGNLTLSWAAGPDLGALVAALGRRSGTRWAVWTKAPDAPLPGPELWAGTLDGLVIRNAPTRAPVLNRVGRAWELWLPARGWMAQLVVGADGVTPAWRPLVEGPTGPRSADRPSGKSYQRAEVTGGRE